MKNVNWMDNLKLRVGYGVTGINVADPYTSLSSLNYNGAFPVQWNMGQSIGNNP